jgi:hypothetical protein
MSLVSPGTRLSAALTKSTRQPSPSIAAAHDAPFASAPSCAMLTRAVVPFHVSRTKASITALWSSATRLEASLVNATKRPAASIDGKPDGPFGCVPARTGAVASKRFGMQAEVSKLPSAVQPRSPQANPSVAQVWPRRSSDPHAVSTVPSPPPSPPAGPDTPAERPEQALAAASTHGPSRVRNNRIERPGAESGTRPARRQTRRAITPRVPYGL